MMNMVGQVVVYSVAGCPNCLAAKNLLKNSGIPIIDVPVDRFPGARSWLQEKTGRSSVPQIFFNEEYVGGNDDLEKVMKDEEAWNKLLTDVQTRQPEEGALLIPHPSEATEVQISEFMRESDPAAPIVEELQESGILHTRCISLFCCVKDTFTGQHFVSWIMSEKGVGEEEAVDIGQDLLDKKYILPVQSDIQTVLMNDPKVYYRLNDSSSSNALNSGGTQMSKLRDAGELSEALRTTMLKLSIDYISADGKAVNYEEMKIAEEFEDYVKMSKDLQRIALEKLDQDELKAFAINIYNALVIHATIVNGPPTNWFTRAKFYARMSYIIGGHKYSLNDIEHGILRANKPSPLQFCPQFGKSDPRLKTSLLQADPRIHFALNCGAKSCPPIKSFSSKNINAELQLATKAYLELDEALQVEEERGVVHLSSLLKWYSSDFGDTTDEVLRWVLRNVAHPEKKAALQRVMNVGKYKIKYIDYDWESNSQD